VNCLTCGTLIQSVTKKSYCQKSCRPSYNSKSVPRLNACEICGVGITQSRTAGNPRRTCSRKCRDRKAMQKRKLKPAMDKECLICQSMFKTKKASQRACSKPCSKEQARRGSLERFRKQQADRPTTRTMPCGWCGKPRTFDIRTSTPRAYHEDCRLQAKRAHNRIRTVRRQGLPSRKKVTHELVIESYGSNCHICELPIDMTLPRTSKQGLTIDHVIPLSRGGADEIENLRPAHWICNNRKSDRLMEDLNA
jgi:5-methylcytosine-specific restriction endonuclease McrA